MRKERFIISFAAALVVCLLVAGYAAMTATYNAAEAPPVPADYIAAVLTHDAAPAPDDPLSGKLQQAQSVLGSGLSDAISALATDESYAARIAERHGETITGWQALDLTGGERVYLAKGSYVILRKGSATCIESASAGLTDIGVSRTLEQDDELSTGTLYQASVPAAGLYVSSACTLILSGDYSIS
ncbi:MAG: hypothetical protein IKM54_02275 [Butyricicoccus sp.]|nr:hypothetical protein [Butyricicoccus sp.]